MAVGPRDIQVTREQVWEWLSEYEGKLEPTKKLRAFLLEKVDELELEDLMIDTSRRDDFSEDEVHVVDMILEDLESYSGVRA